MLDWCLLLCRTHVLLSLCAVMSRRDTVGSGVGFGTTKSQGVDKELAELARRKLTFIEVPTRVASEVALCSPSSLAHFVCCRCRACVRVHSPCVTGQVPSLTKADSTVVVTTLLQRTSVEGGESGTQWWAHVGLSSLSLSCTSVLVSVSPPLHPPVL